MNFFNDLDSAAEFAKDLLRSSPNGSVSITTMQQGKSEGFCVSTVTNSSSDDTEHQTAKFFSATQPST